jgi:hypothetical protein
MFSGLKRLIGKIDVTQDQKLIHVEGLPADVVAKDIAKIWATSKITNFMFSQMGRSSIAFNPFFAPDVAYTLKTVLQQRSRNYNNRALQKVIDLMYENTWLRDTIRDDHHGILDFGALDQLNLTLLPHQEEFLRIYNEMVPKMKLKGYILAASPGSGKAQPLSAAIKVPGGWSMMGKMQVGTEVITPKGTVTKVTGVFPQGKKDIYRVSFSDGRSTEVCGDHLWKVHLRHEGGEHWKIKTTKEILESSSFRDGRAYIPLIQSEQGPDLDLPIHPYLLGVLIGDGCISQEFVHVSNPESFIKEKIADLLDPDMQIGNQINANDFSLTGIKVPGEPFKNSLKRKLADLGLQYKLSHTKFIPEDYLHASHQQRLALLQGLMDTDGYAGTGGSATYTTTSLQLAEQVQGLAHSLGAIATIAVKRKSFTYKGEKKQGRVSYDVHIRHQYPEELFTLPRKKERMNNDNQYASSLKLRIDRIEYVGQKEAQCISVEDEDHLYVTNQFIVTHNTINSIALGLTLNADVQIYIVPKNSVDEVWSKTLGTIFKKPQEHSFWTSTSNKPLEWGYKHYVFHYEQLARAIEFFKANQNQVRKPFMVVDESHNLNELGSLRTNLWIDLCRVTNCQHILPMSGTPLKAIGNEAIPILTVLCPDFDEDASIRFREIFGKNSSRANDILRNRLGLMMYKVDAVKDMEPDEPRLNIKMPNGGMYTLEAVKDVMRKFIEERMAFYKANFKEFEKTYFYALSIFQRTLHGGQDVIAFKKYQGYISTIRQGYDPKTMKDMVAWCNHYEKSRIAPTLPRDLKVAFLDARSVVKYMDLKVQGEALGRVLGKMRSQCHVDMVPYVGLPKLIDGSLSKTVIFTSYVQVVKTCDTYLQEQGYQPLLVYGDTNKDLKSIINRFAEDEDLNPLVATFDSLSTAVPLTMASTSVFMNSPFRDHEYKQARARTARLGQRFPCTIWNVFLDTNGEPNISTRSNDIMNWSREMVASMMGTNSHSLDVALESFNDSSEVQDDDKVEVDGFITQPNWMQWSSF